MQVLRFKNLLEEGKGYKVKDHSIPLVSSAVIFDLIQSDIIGKIMFQYGEFS